MSRIRKNIEPALAELLVGSDTTNAHERPKRLTLPEVLHERIALTVDQSRDGFERSVGFNYLEGTWVAGKQKIGRVDSVTTRPYLFRPHIRMHTHPKPDMDEQDTSMSTMAIQRGWSAEKTAKMIAANRQAYEGYYMLPSSSDIAIIHPKSSGLIGSMIASESGIFLSLRKSLADTEDINMSALMSAQKAAEEYDAKITEGVNKFLSTEDTRSFVLNAAAKALSHKYAVYVSEGPDSPELFRIDPA